MAKPRTNLTTTLYRHYDKENLLLYVGISSAPLTRQQNHAETSPWWEQITLITLEHFASRQEALRAEKLAIIKEKPLFNTMLSRDELLPRQKRERWHDGIRPRSVVKIVYPEDDSPM